MTIQANSYDFTTPVGRLVSGDAFEAQTTDQQNRPLLDKNGQPTKRWFMGVAFDKANPEFGIWFQGLQQQAMRDWPHLFDAATGQCRLPTFSMKVIDGDGLDQSGRPWAEREGYAGHWVVRFTSGFAPTIYHKDRYDPMMRVTDPMALKRGYYVRIAGSAKGNGNNEKPGMYCNLNLVEIYGTGPEIVGGPDASQAFGASAAPQYIPPGMQALSMATTSLSAGMPAMGGMGVPAMPGAGAVGGMGGAVGGMGVPAMGAGIVGDVGGMSGPVGMTADGRQTMNPATDMGQTLPNMAAPSNPLPSGVSGQSGIDVAGTAAGMIASQASNLPSMDTAFVQTVAGEVPQVGVTMGPNAGQHTYEQWRQAGYSDEQLRATGVII